MLYIQPVTVMYCHKQTRFSRIAKDSITMTAVDARPQSAHLAARMIANDQDESSTNHQIPDVGRFRSEGAMYPAMQARHRRA